MWFSIKLAFVTSLMVMALGCQRPGIPSDCGDDCGDALDECSPAQRDLACELLSSANVDVARAHPSGVVDNAFAFNNLRDMCNWQKASRSSYSCYGRSCSAPGGTVCLSLKLLRYLVELQIHGRIIINELAGACHSCTSRHYSGLAVDLHKDARSSEYLRKCFDMNGWGQEERNHVHCQFYDQPHPNGF